MLYSTLPSFVLGFHGCDAAVARGVFNRKQHLRFSENKYDWLGSGTYFWENSPDRAMEWAVQLRDAGKIVVPAVIGAIIDLGRCLNTLDTRYLKVIKQAYEDLEQATLAAGDPLPTNRPLRDSRDLLLRDLDCAVINTVHHVRQESAEPPFDTVRAAFIEGRPLYKNSGFKDRNHIQICVRNLTCIKGYFRPLDEPATA